MVDHFTDLLNSPAPETMTDIRPAAYHVAIVCSIPSIKEIIEDKKMLNNGKSPGPSLILAKALEADPQTTARNSKLWETKELQQDWHLLSVPVKILNRKILDRIKPNVDKQPTDQQAGSRGKKN